MMNLSSQNTTQLCSFQASDFTEECRTIVRDHARNFFKDSSLRRTLNMQCPDEIKTIKCEPPGQKYIFCILDRKDEVTDYYCQHIIQRIEYLLTTNFGLASDFNELCKTEINRIHCNAKIRNEYSMVRFLMYFIREFVNPL